MEYRSYPQETIGTTLRVVDDGDEWRRVFLRCQNAYMEVGEFTRGSLTEELYDAPVHFHSVHVYDYRLESFVREYFCDDAVYLCDLMDSLSKQKVPFGYLNVQAGKHVSFRPASRYSHAASRC